MSSNSMEQLTSEDVAILQTSSPWLIKSGIFLDLGREVAAETNHLFLNNANDFAVGHIGMNSDKVANMNYRNDKKLWLTPKYCKERNLTATTLLVKKMMQLCKSISDPLSLNGDYSIQLACFPGDGSRYVKHSDTFLDRNGRPTSENRGKTYRKLTMIYYLNESFEGGQLRIFPCDGHSTSRTIDVDPSIGTMVIFRSDCVEHEVLPSFQNRFAITLWASSNLELPLLPRELDHSWQIPLAPVSVDGNYNDMANSGTIFVSIANYRDSEGPLTVLDLFAKAQNPYRIFVGYVLQADERLDQLCFISDSFVEKANSEYPGAGQWLRSNVRSLLHSVAVSTGPCWARSTAHKLWSGERYYLQIDSHMRFRPNWDMYLIILLEIIRRNESTKPVITTYPVGYQYPNSVPLESRPTILIPSDFDENHILRQTAKVVSIPEIADIPYLQSPLWAAGFSFSDSSVIHDVPYSSALPYLFFGEEISMAARLFTHGYRFYAPTTSVLYHLYTRQFRPTFIESLKSEEDFLGKRRSSQNIVLHMLGCDTPENKQVETGLIEDNMKSYWLGLVSTLSEFEKDIGVDFFEGTVRKDYDWGYLIVPSSLRKNQIVNICLAEEINIEDIICQALQQLEGKLSNATRVASVMDRLQHYLS